MLKPARFTITPHPSDEPLAYGTMTLISLPTLPPTRNAQRESEATRNAIEMDSEM